MTGLLTTTQTAECWKPISGFESLYEVSNLGRVRRIAGRQGTHAGRILKVKGRPTKDGYPRVQLCDAPRIVDCLVHILVLETFVGPCPEGLEACHDDGNSANAMLSNLRWDSPVNNAKDKEQHGTVARGTSHGNVRLTEEDVVAIRSASGSQRAIADQFGICRQHVSDIKAARRWSHLNAMMGAV